VIALAHSSTPGGEVWRRRATRLLLHRLSRPPLWAADARNSSGRRVLPTGGVFGRARTAGAIVRRRRHSAGPALAPGLEDRHQLRFDGQQRPDDVVEERCRELLRGGGVAFQ
jgi:hypothetical protein